MSNTRQFSPDVISRGRPYWINTTSKQTFLQTVNTKTTTSTEQLFQGIFTLEFSQVLCPQKDGKRCGITASAEQEVQNKQEHLALKK